MNAPKPNLLPTTIGQYLEQLTQALAGADPALVQDALYDAEDYLRSEWAEHPELSEAALLASHVEPSVAGPPRRYYRITDTGQAVLTEWAAAWRATRDSVDSVLEGLLP